MNRVIRFRRECDKVTNVYGHQTDWPWRELPYSPEVLAALVARRKDIDLGQIEVVEPPKRVPPMPDAAPAPEPLTFRIYVDHEPEDWPVTERRAADVAVGDYVVHARRVESCWRSDPGEVAFQVEDRHFVDHYPDDWMVMVLDRPNDG